MFLHTPATLTQWHSDIPGNAYPQQHHHCNSSLASEAGCWCTWWSAFRCAFVLLADMIESDARLVFSDVVDEFCSIRGVASRFESWRNTDADAYREAYVNLCLPKVLGPLVRLKMLMWNPLKVSYTVFVYIFINHGHEVRWWHRTVEVWVNPEHQWQTASPDERTVDAQSLWTSMFAIFNLCGDQFKYHCLDLLCLVLMIWEETAQLVIGVPHFPAVVPAMPSSVSLFISCCVDGSVLQSFTSQKECVLYDK